MQGKYQRKVLVRTDDCAEQCVRYTFTAIEAIEPLIENGKIVALAAFPLNSAGGTKSGTGPTVSSPKT